MANKFTFNPLTSKFDVIPDISGLCPYTGATGNVNLGLFNLTLRNFEIYSEAPYKLTLGDQEIGNDIILDTSQTLVNQTFTFPNASGTFALLGVANVFTANQTISNTAPSLVLTDTTASAKSLTIAVDANIVNLRESAGASGSLLVLDLANGRVGIGTTGPGAALDIAAAANPSLTTYNTVTGDYIRWGYSSSFYGMLGHTAAGATSAWIGNNFNNDAATFGIRMKGNAVGNEVVTVLGSGNVGIGTTASTTALAFDGQTAHTFWQERHITPNTAGNNFTLAAGGATRLMVSTVSVTAGGQAYAVNNVLTLALPTGGTAATCTVATLTDGTGIRTTTINAGGTGYTNGTQTLTVVQGGASGGTVSVTVAGGIVTAILSTLTSGTGYSVANGLDTTGGGGTGAKLNITVLGGPVATVTVTTKGANYATGTKTTTVVPTGGSGCTINVLTLESATDRAGGITYISGGISTGTGVSGVEIQTCPAGASSAVDNTLTTIIKASGNTLGFYGVSPVVRPTALTTQLTTVTCSAPGTPDYAIADLTNTLPYGFVSADEGQSVLKVIANLQTRVAELEQKLTALGLLT